MSSRFPRQHLLELPDDPEMAFVHFEGLARDRLEADFDRNAYSGPLDINYMTAVTAAANAYGIAQLQGWSCQTTTMKLASLLPASSGKRLYK